MGWSFCRNWDKKSLVDHLLNDDTYHKPMAHSVRGDHLWVAFINHNPECPPDKNKYICLFLLQSGGADGWGYKDITESMGPREHDCPVSFFKLVPDPGSFATEWRAEVRRIAKEILATPEGD